MKQAATKIAIFGILILGAGVILQSAISARAIDPVTVRLGTLAPTGSSYHAALVEMGQKWRDATGGAVKLTIYADGTQGGEADHGAADARRSAQRRHAHRRRAERDRQVGWRAIVPAPDVSLLGGV